VLYMHAMNEPNRFQKEDLFFYTALSSLASMAIENALLHSKSRKAEEALERARADLEIQVRERTASSSRPTRGWRSFQSQTDSPACTTTVT